jgi:hypothetical protein
VAASQAGSRDQDRSGEFGPAYRDTKSTNLTVR